MDIGKILAEWKQKKFKPVYWLEGDEEYYIDQLVNFAEKEILTKEEADFNLNIFYGKDALWEEIINTCRRYPMFSERQVVIVKEAQHLREIEKLEFYIQKPLTSTILIVATKNKKLDGRTRFAGFVKKNTVLVTTKKMNDGALPEWVAKLAGERGYTITPKANMLLVDHIGNNPGRIENEIDKIIINLPGHQSITEDDIERFVGISKDYNSFELQKAVARKDLAGTIRILQYFEANPKAAPPQLILPTLYSFFSKVYMISGFRGPEESIAKEIGVPFYFVKDYVEAYKRFSAQGIEKVLLLLHQYNLKIIGVNSGPLTEGGDLMKEMAIKMMID